MAPAMTARTGDLERDGYAAGDAIGIDPNCPSLGCACQLRWQVHNRLLANVLVEFGQRTETSHRPAGLGIGEQSHQDVNQPQ